MAGDWARVERDYRAAAEEREEAAARADRHAEGNLFFILFHFHLLYTISYFNYE